LYRFVCSQDQPVSRDQAAQAVGVARHKAKFHLDRLEAEGLLEADYVRLTGRTGPGAGRPAKRYRRGTKEFAITLPARDYELAARVMADAIAESARTGAPISEVVNDTAAVYGAAIAATARDHPSSADAALDIVVRVLTEHAYEPRRTENTVTLAYCPF
jgi:predicted ArsR family transcriptional regulator